jgi:hypothetical protein
MRELKFRAWIEKEKYMALQGEPDLETLGSFMYHYSDNSILMQYTGLKDKNGKEIYEGDIDNRKRVCEYFPNLGCFGFKNPKYAPITFLGQFIASSRNIVIGNIYENPELLKSSE